MPRPRPSEGPSPRVLAILARSRDRPDERADGVAGEVAGPSGPGVADPPWVRADQEPYVPTREELGWPDRGRRSTPPAVGADEAPAAVGGQPGTAGGGGFRAVLSRVLALPSSLAQARWAPSRRAVSGAVAAVLLAAGVFGLRVAWARDASTATPVTDIRATASDAAPASPGAPGAIVAASASRSAGPGTGGTAAGVASLSAAPLVVHVVGQVLHPGIVRLPPGSRVVDAVAAAGGARRGADLAGINLARLVVDGEQIRVPRPGEVVAAAPGATAAGGGAGSGAPVSLNSADVAALDSLPGIGPVLAQRIVDWRTENRRFTSVDELGEVSGIGEKLLAQLRPKVTL